MSSGHSSSHVFGAESVHGRCDVTAAGTNLTFHFSRTAPVHGDGGAQQLGTSQTDRDGLVFRDVGGRLVLRVGHAQSRAFRNDRYPVYDGRAVRVGWLGAWEGVVLGDKRVTLLTAQRPFSSSCRVLAVEPSRPRRGLAALEHLRRPGCRTALLSVDWRVRFRDGALDDRLRLLVLRSRPRTFGTSAAAKSSQGPGSVRHSWATDA